MRAAYAAWDAKPCDSSLANAVVRSINDVIAGYRNSVTGLPSLHYIVLTGTDELTPMARTPDPVTLSPEENVAADLAFTTNGLVAGNALYNSAAENNILTDGAYGAFLSIPWLGHDLLLPQLSISRLVETPADILGQVNRYLKASGYTGTPQTAVGTLSPQKLLTTGYDFLADGAQGVHDNLHGNFAAAAQQDTLGGGRLAINTPGSPAPWTAPDIFGAFFQPTGAADVASLNAHYNHFEFEAADGSLGTTGDPGTTTAAIAARILFTMGCHGGLNVADTLGGSGGTLSRLAAALQPGPGRDVHREHRLRLRRQRVGGALRAAALALREEPPLRRELGRRAVGRDAPAVLRRRRAHTTSTTRR